MPSSFCGLRKAKPLRRRKPKEGKPMQRASEDSGQLDVRHWDWDADSESGLNVEEVLRQRQNPDWAREDQVSTILEPLEESRRNTPNWENEPKVQWILASAFGPKPVNPAIKNTRFLRKPQQQHTRGQNSTHVGLRCEASWDSKVDSTSADRCKLFSMCWQ